MDFRFKRGRLANRFAAFRSSRVFRRIWGWVSEKGLPVLRKTVLWGSFGILAFAAISYASVEIAAFGRTYSQPDSVPKNAVGLVLGTSAKTADGRPNAYFANRITAAAELYRKKRVDCLLVS